MLTANAATLTKLPTNLFVAFIKSPHLSSTFDFTFPPYRQRLATADPFFCFLDTVYTTFQHLLYASVPPFERIMLDPVNDFVLQVFMISRLAANDCKIPLASQSYSSFF